MKKLLFYVALLSSILLSSKQIHAQEASATDKIINFPTTCFSKINDKATFLQEGIDRQTEKYLQRMAKQERQLQKKLMKIDSTAAKQLFANSEKQYQQLAKKLKDTGSAHTTSLKGEYLSGMDSLKSSLTFLRQNNQLLGNNSELQQKVTTSLSNVTALESKLQQTEEVKAFIQERKQQIKTQLSHYTNLPASVTSCVTDFNKQVYYYNAQIKEYKETLNDPDKVVEKGLSF